jgi:hypothetical protein
MPVHTEMRDDLENRYKESKEEFHKAQWETEQAKNAYEGAQNELDYHKKEVSGQWGQDVAPGNTSAKRESLEAERDRKYDEYQKASEAEDKAKNTYEENKEHWENYQKIEEQAYGSKEEENDNDKGM